MELFYDYERIGKDLVEIGEIDMAVIMYRRAIEIFSGIPEVFRLYHHLGRLMLQKSDWREAAVLLHQAIQAKPASFEIYKDFSFALAKLQENERSDALDLIKKLVAVREDEKNVEIKQAFTRAFSSKYRNGKEIESASGIGSSLSNTSQLRKYLPQLFQDFNISTILDIPCGDFHWMKEIEYPPHIHYLGADIIDKIITENQANYGKINRLFLNMDLMYQSLPKVDLIICRDCLIHFSNENVFRAINNIKNSGSKYLLTTTFTDKDNHDIQTTHYRPINLQREPFNFPDPMIFINEGYSSLNYADKSLGMWSIESLPEFA